MLQNFRIIFYAISVGATVVFIVFSFPALTTRDGVGTSEAAREEFEALFSQELSFCELQPNDMNCRCFASISRTILADDAARVPGARYADKHDLARGQAGHSC